MWDFDFSNYLIDISYICNCCMSELCAGFTFMSGHEIPANQFSWPTMLLYKVFLLGVKRSFLVFCYFFDKAISGIESTYEFWSILTLKLEFCLNPIPIYVNAFISSESKLKISFNLLMITGVNYTFWKCLLNIFFYGGQ